jgi:peptidylprolyl isomerase
MKLTAPLLFAAFALAQSTVAVPAQTPAKPAVTTHSTTAARHAAVSHSPVGCIKLPELSPKIPALPAGAPCPKALYTITVVPDVRLDYASPLEGDLAKELGIEPTSFTLAYIDTKAGTGEPAMPHKYLTVKYTGYLADGTTFDASDNHPEKSFTFQAGAHQVVAGWDTGFAGMKVGARRRLFVPFQLGYGPNGNPQGRIPARAELIFDMELVAVSDTPPAKPATPAAAPMKPASNATPPTSAAPPTAPAATAPSTPPASAAPSTPATPAKPQ